MYVYKFDEDETTENNMRFDTTTRLGNGLDTTMMESVDNVDRTMTQDKTTTFSAKSDRTTVAASHSAKTGNHVGKRGVTHILDTCDINTAPDSPRFSKITRHRAQSEGAAADSAKRRSTVDALKTRRTRSVKYQGNNKKPGGKLHRTKSQVIHCTSCF